MTQQQLEEFLILRSLDEPITDDHLQAVSEKSGNVLAELRDEGVDIRWVESDVLLNEDGDVSGTICHYQAETEAAVREHADRAGLPTTRIDRRGHPLDGE